MTQYEAPPTGGFREEDYNVKNYFCPRIELSFIGGATIFFAHNLHT